MEQAAGRRMEILVCLLGSVSCHLQQYKYHWSHTNTKCINQAVWIIRDATWPPGVDPEYEMFVICPLRIPVALRRSLVGSARLTGRLLAVHWHWSEANWAYVVGDPEIHIWDPGSRGRCWTDMDQRRLISPGKVLSMGRRGYLLVYWRQTDRQTERGRESERERECVCVCASV